MRPIPCASEKSCDYAAFHGSGTSRKRHDILEVLEDREGLRATIVTSQLPHPQWHEYIGDPTVADAILDRIVHRAYKVNLTGPSRRKPKTNPTED